MRTLERTALAALACCLLLPATAAAASDARTRHFGEALAPPATTTFVQANGRRRRRTPTRAKAKPRSTAGREASTQTANTPKAANTSQTTNAPKTANTARTANTSGRADVSLEQPFASTLREPKPGEEQKRGLLTRVECAPGNVVFHVRVGEQTLRLRNKDLGSVQIVTYTPDVSGEFTCDERKPPNHVLATFRPAKDARTKTDGLLVALDFIPKDWQ